MNPTEENSDLEQPQPSDNSRKERAPKNPRLASPDEDRPLSPNSEREIANKIAALETKIKDKEDRMEALELKIQTWEDLKEDAPEFHLRDVTLKQLRKQASLLLAFAASLQEEKTSLQEEKVVLQKRLAAREKSSDLPPLPESVSTYCLPPTIPHISQLSHSVCEEYTEKPDKEKSNSNPTSGLDLGDSYAITPALEGARPVSHVELAYQFVEDAGINNPRRKENNLVFYLRDRCFWQMKFIQHNVIKEGAVGFIQGHPGTGKSTTALVTVAALCRDERWNVLWVHAHYSFGSTRPLHLLCLHMSPGGTVAKFNPIVPEQLEQLTHSLTKSGQTTETTKTLLVLDGIRQDAGNEQTMLTVGMRWFWGDKPNRRYLCISSQGFSLRDRDEDSSQNNIQDFKQWSWTLPEYRKALESKRFAESVEDVLDAPLIPGEEPDKLLAKYYYAGGCARYMFSFKTNEVETSINKAVEAVTKKRVPTDIDSFESSNSLFKFHLNGDKGEKDIVSDYARERIHATLGSEWLRSLAKIRNLSDSAKGSLFQAWVVKKIEEPKFRDALKNNQDSVDWFTPQEVRRVPFAKLKYTEEWENKLIESTNKQEPSVDALFFRREKGESKITLYLLQITIARSHKLNMNACKILAEKFQASAVKIYFIVPSGVTTFKVNPLLNPGALQPFGWKSGEEDVKKHLESNCVLKVDGWI